jgi:hypothetical protein
MADDQLTKYCYLRDMRLVCESLEAVLGLLEDSKCCHFTRMSGSGIS